MTHGIILIIISVTNAGAAAVAAAAAAISGCRTVARCRVQPSIPTVVLATIMANSDQIPLRYLVRTSFEPDSVMEFGFSVHSVGLARRPRFLPI